MKWLSSKESSLTILFVFLGIFFIGVGLQPIYPQISWYLPHVFLQEAEPELLSFDITDEQVGYESEISSSRKRIRIPAIDVDMEIIDEEGVGEQEAFARGAWLLPRTGVPGEASGNAVIAAHRFLHTSGPNTFFHLDKLKDGDEIIVDWEGERYRYIVDSSKVVPPTAVDILEPTDRPILTLFTCTPVYTTKNRLVVTAKLST